MSESPPASAASPSTADALEHLLGELRSAGQRVTPARRLLLQCLVDDHGHRTAEELAETVQARAPEVHLSTIYRNLDELERLGLVEHAHLGHGAATYHLAEARHGHLVCSRCGRTTEVPERLFSAIRRSALQEYGFLVEPHHLALTGTCAACAAEGLSGTAERPPA